MPAEARYVPSFVRDSFVFALGHLTHFVKKLVWGLGFGLAVELWHRRVHLVAAVCGAFVLGASITLGYAYLSWLGDAARDPAFYLWVAWALGALMAGVLMGFWARGIALFECYLAVLLVLPPLWLWLGGQALFAPTPLWEAMPPAGVLLLGPMWDRILGFAGLLALVLMLCASSIAYLAFGEQRRLDWAPSFAHFVVRGHLRSLTGGLVRTTTWVATLGIALGVAALIAVTAVMSGYQEDIQDKILSTNAHLVLQKYGLDFANYRDLQKRATSVAGVEAAAPFTFNEAMLHAGGQSVGALVKGVLPEQAARVTRLAKDLCCAPFTSLCSAYPTSHASEEALADALRAAPGELPGAVIGVALFERLGLPVGSVITLMTPVAMAGARGDAPRRMQFRLCGVFRSGMYEFDSRLVYLGLGASQALFGMGDTVSGLELRVTRPAQVALLSDRLLTLVGGYPYRVLDWRELNQGIFSALKMQKVVMFLVLLCIVVVASFNIASTLFMTVVEKSREVAILKSMGARDHQIGHIFVAQGWLTGLMGILLGTLLGVGAAWALNEAGIKLASDVYMVGSLRVQVRLTEVLMTGAAALVITHLATLFPALRAARSKPIAALRDD